MNYILINGNKIKIEIANTNKERQVGLMHRESLCKNCGMLFIFDYDDYHSFWMKNTLIPLDIIFISKDYKIVDIIEAEPCKRFFCKFYTPKEKALYVLEVNKGLTKENNINIGDKVKIK